MFISSRPMQIGRCEKNSAVILVVIPPGGGRVSIHPLEEHVNLAPLEKARVVTL